MIERLSLRSPLLADDYDSLLGYAVNDPEVGQRLAELPAVAETDDLKELLVDFANRNEKPTRRMIEIAANQRGVSHREKVGIVASYHRVLLKAAKSRDEAVAMLENLKAQMAGMPSTGAPEIKLKPIPDYMLRQTMELPLDKIPRRVAVVASYLANETHEQVTLKHLVAATVILSASIGKRAEFANWGTDYYLNILAVVLLPTGGNKTGLYSSIKRLCRDVVKYHSPAASTLEGFLDGFCSTIAPDRNRQRLETERLVRERVLADRADHRGQFCVVDELRALLLTLLPWQQVARNGQILCRLFERDDLEMRTATNGLRVIGDTCLNLLGLSQADPWNEEMRSATLQKGGLAGRILPINPQQFDCDPQQPLAVTLDEARDAIASIMGDASTMDEPWAVSEPVRSVKAAEKIRVTFGDNGLTEVKAWFRAIENNKAIAAELPQEWAALESKVLIQAAKLAAVWAVAEMPLGATTVDASKWLRVAMAIVGGSHMSNLNHDSLLTEQGQVLDKIKRQILKRQKVNRSDLLRYCNLKAHELNAYLQVMLSSGTIKAIDGKRVGEVLYVLG